MSILCPEAVRTGQTETIAMIKPTIHMNGSGRDTLLDGYATAVRAVGIAIESLCDAAPNARDYYPQGDGAYAEARCEHKARVAKLRDVQDELLALARDVRRAL